MTSEAQKKWLENRKRGIGGSEIAAILGENPYSDALAVYEAKVEGKVVEENEHMRRGREMEPLIIEKFSETHAHKGWTVEPNVWNMFWHPDVPVAFATPDALIYTPDMGIGILECKSTKRKDSIDWENGEIPTYYYAQIQWQMACTGVEWGWFAYDRYGRYREYPEPIYRDDDLVSYMLSEAQEFWAKYVIPQRPPEKISVSTKLPPAKVFELNEEQMAIISQFKSLNEKRIELESESASLRERIISMIGDADEIAFEGTPVATYRAVKRESFDKKKFKEEFPDLYAEYIRTVEQDPTQRRFCVL